MSLLFRLDGLLGFFYRHLDTLFFFAPAADNDFPQHTSGLRFSFLTFSRTLRGEHYRPGPSCWGHCVSVYRFNAVENQTPTSLLVFFFIFSSSSSLASVWSSYTTSLLPLSGYIAPFGFVKSQSYVHRAITRKKILKEGGENRSQQFSTRPSRSLKFVEKRGERKL